MGRRGAWLLVVVCLGAGAARADVAKDEALLDALALGLPPAQAVAALDAAGQLGTPKAEAVLLAYARARDATVRAHAVAALGSGPAVLAALGDMEPTVRAAAGAALAARKDARAVAPLLALLKRGDPSAVAPLAALANPGVARQVAELTGQAPDALLAQTLGAMLLRKDLGPDATYSLVVRTLGAMPGRGGVEALRAYVSTGVGKASRREAEQVLGERK